jgi:hypothetical protein
VSIFRSIAGLVIALVCLTANARDEGWKKEPDTVLGATLGARLDYAQLTQCSQGKRDTRYVFCSLAVSGWGKTIPLGGFPLSEIKNGLATLDDDENLVELSMWSSRSDFSALRSAMIERYGPPTGRELATWKNKLSAAFPSEELTWVGKKVIIILMERGASADESSLAFASAPWFERRIREDAKRVKAGASKF